MNFYFCSCFYLVKTRYMSEILSISLLNLLSKSELTALSKYLKSPFFTQKKHLLILFSILRSAGTRVSETPKTAFARVFPGESFDQHKWNKALSDLNVCIREFLAIQQFQQHPELHPLLEVEALYRRDNDTLFRNLTSALLKHIPGGGAKLDKTEAWWQRFQVHKLVGMYPHADRMKIAEKKVADMEASLDTYYFLCKLQFACNHLSGLRVFHRSQTKVHTDFGQIVRQAEQISQINESPLLRVYCLLTGMLAESGVHFDDFYQGLAQFSNRLDPAELGIVIAHACNYCTASMRRGRIEALDWYLQLIALEPETGIPQGEDILLNLAVTFAMAGKKAEFDKLLKARGSTLPAERREDAMILLSACWHFYQGNYSKTQSELVLITTRHPRYTLMWHSLAVRNIYMLSAQDPGFDTQQVILALERFSDFLRRQSVYSESFCQSFAEMIWFIHKMCSVRTRNGLKKKELVKELDNKFPASRDWIKAALDQLPD